MSSRFSLCLFPCLFPLPCPWQWSHLGSDPLSEVQITLDLLSLSPALLPDEIESASNLFTAILSFKRQVKQVLKEQNIGDIDTMCTLVRDLLRDNAIAAFNNG
eukprot:6943535-Ditylum_brightwellii.AAC.3